MPRMKETCTMRSGVVITSTEIYDKSSQLVLQRVRHTFASPERKNPVLGGTTRYIAIPMYALLDPFDETSPPHELIGDSSLIYGHH